MRAYERFLNYVVVNTRSDESSETYPSTACQFDLGKVLVEELKQLGIADARMDEFCYFLACQCQCAGGLSGT